LSHKLDVKVWRSLASYYTPLNVVQNFNAARRTSEGLYILPLCFSILDQTSNLKAGRVSPSQRISQVWF